MTVMRRFKQQLMASKINTVSRIKRAYHIFQSVRVFHCACRYSCTVFIWLMTQYVSTVR